MELITFMNYLFSIGALLLGAFSLHSVLKLEKIREEWYTYKKEMDYRVTLMERQLNMSTTKRK